MRMKKIPLILMCGAACFSAVTGCAGSGDASKACIFRRVSTTCTEF